MRGQEYRSRDPRHGEARYFVNCIPSEDGFKGLVQIKKAWMLSLRNPCENSSKRHFEVSRSRVLIPPIEENAIYRGEIGGELPVLLRCAFAVSAAAVGVALTTATQ